MYEVFSISGATNNELQLANAYFFTSSNWNSGSAVNDAQFWNAYSSTNETDKFNDV